MSPSRSLAPVEFEEDVSARLMSAFQQDQFVLYTQPIEPIGPPRKERTFQEIFIRQVEEDAMKLPPGTFFQVLEECRMLPYLDRWVVNRLARWVRSALGVWADREIPRFNVNLSEVTLGDADFGPYVKQYVDRSYLSKGALGFEIQWKAALRRAVPLRRLMADLRQHACTFTIAGVDGSAESLAALNALSPNFVKINSATINPGRLIEIQRRCRVLGCKTIAEFVENAQVLERMHAAKVDFVQGFHISLVQPL